MHFEQFFRGQAMSLSPAHRKRVALRMEQCRTSTHHTSLQHATLRAGSDPAPLVSRSELERLAPEGRGATSQEAEKEGALHSGSFWGSS